MTPSKLRCVVVDDDQQFLAKLRRFLESTHPEFEVITFPDSVEAVHHLRSSRADVVLTAYLMPQIDGLQLVSAVRAVDPEVPICIMSAVPIREVGLARGATAFVSKANALAFLDQGLRQLCTRSSTQAA